MRTLGGSLLLPVLGGVSAAAAFVPRAVGFRESATPGVYVLTTSTPDAFVSALGGGLYTLSDTATPGLGPVEVALARFTIQTA